MSNSGDKPSKAITIDDVIFDIEDYVGGNIEGIEKIDRMGFTVFLRRQLKALVEASDSDTESTDMRKDDPSEPQARESKEDKELDRIIEELSLNFGNPDHRAKHIFEKAKAALTKLRIQDLQDILDNSSGGGNWRRVILTRISNLEQSLKEKV